jgi:hypothetical protein
MGKENKRNRGKESELRIVGMNWKSGVVLKQDLMGLWRGWDVVKIIESVH